MTYFWRLLGSCPVVASTVGLFLGFFDLVHVGADLVLESRTVRSEVLVETEFGS